MHDLCALPPILHFYQLISLFVVYFSCIFSSILQIVSNVLYRFHVYTGHSESSKQMIRPWRFIVPVSHPHDRHPQQMLDLVPASLLACFCGDREDAFRF